MSEQSITISPREQEKSDENVEELFDLFMNNKFVEAEKRLRERSDTEMLAAIVLGMMLFYKAAASFNDDDIQMAVNVLSHAEGLSEMVLDKYRNGIVGTIVNTSKSLFTAVNSLNPFRAATPEKKETDSDIEKEVSSNSLQRITTLPTKTEPGYTNEHLRALNINSEANLLIGILTFTQESVMAFVKGGMRLRKALSNISVESNEISTLKNYEQFYDKNTLSGVLFGVGAFNLIIATLPSRIKSLFSFIGYKVDREYGIQSLEKCAESDGLRSSLANLFLLSWLLASASAAPHFLNEEHIPKAGHILESTLKKYPENILFLSLKGRLLRQKKELLQSIDVYNSTSQLELAWPQLSNLCNFDLGLTYCFNLEFEKALACFERLLGEHYWSQALYSFFCAVCCESITGQGDKAAKFYKNIPGLAKNRMNGKPIPLEQYAIQKSKQFEYWKKHYSLESSEHQLYYLSGLEFIHIWNGFSNMGMETLSKCLSNLDQVKSYLEKIGASPDDIRKSDKDERWYSMLYLKGAICREMGNDDQAKDCFYEVLFVKGAGEKEAMNMEDDTLDVEKVFSTKKLRIFTEEPSLLPVVFYDLGVMAWNKRKLSLSLKLMDKAKSYSNYCLENRFNMRIHLASTKLREELQKCDQK